MVAISNSNLAQSFEDGLVTGYLSNLDTNIICEAILPYLERLTDLIFLSHTSRHFRSTIFSGRTLSTWSSAPVDICVDSSCKFGCGRFSVSSSLAWSILKCTSTVSVRLHMPFSKLGVLLEAILGNKLQALSRLHLRFRIDDDAAAVASTLNLESKTLSKSMRCVKLGHLIIYGYPDTFPTAGCLDLLMTIFGLHLETLKFMESSPRNLLKLLHKQICPSLLSLSIEGEQPLEDLLGLHCNTLKNLCLHNTAIKLSSGLQHQGPLQFSNLTSFELTDRADTGNLLWKTGQDVRDGMSVLPISLKDLTLRIDSRLANAAIIESSKRLLNLEMLMLQLPDKDENGPDDINYSSVVALKHGCPSLIALEITDGLIGFDVDAFVALKDFRNLRRIKLLYDDNIVDALPRLLEESSSSSIEDIQFYENAGEIFGEDDGSVRWHAMQERLVEMSADFVFVNIGLSDCWWP